MATQNDKHYLTQELAQELLDQIIGYLDLSNCLKLRLIFSEDAFKDKVAPTLRPYLTNLFVSPTETSLFNFEHIAKSPFYNDYVEKVTFVPQALSEYRNGFHNSELEEFATVAQYRDTIRESYKRIELSGFEAGRSLELYRGLVSEHRIHYQSWEGQSSNEYPADVYAALKAGLCSLPKLKQLIISPDIHQDGLNASCLLYSDAYERQREARMIHGLCNSLGGSAAKDFLQNKVSFECTHALFAAISHTKLELDSLAIGDSHDARMHDIIQDSIDWRLEDILPVFRKLKKLTISCEDCGDYYFSDPHKRTEFWKGVASTAIGLDELTLFTGAGLDDWHHGIYKVLDHFLEFGNYPGLRIIRIRGPQRKPDLIRGADFDSFLIKHRKTLEEVDLSGVLFSDMSMHEGICATIRHVLDDAAARLSKLRSFKMLVHRRNEHFDGECQRFGVPATCEKYFIRRGVWMHRDELDNLASLLGVMLKEGSWDFGEYAMRTKA